MCGTAQWLTTQASAALPAAVLPFNVYAWTTAQPSQIQVCPSILASPLNAQAWSLVGLW